MRQISENGRQVIVYFCCESEFRASYKKDPYSKKADKVDARTPEQIQEKNRQYYQANAEKERERAKAYRTENQQEYLLNAAYKQQKDRLRTVELHRQSVLRIMDEHGFSKMESEYVVAKITEAIRLHSDFGGFRFFINGDAVYKRRSRDRPSSYDSVIILYNKKEVSFGFDYRQ